MVEIKNSTKRKISSNLEKIANPNLNTNKGRSSFGMPHIKEYINVPVESLFTYEKQARTFFDEEGLNELADSIKNFGIRQPLSVIRKKDQLAKFEIISGERRLKAAKIAGLKFVPCIIVEDVQNAEFVALIENIQRENLHPIELARGLNTIIEKNDIENLNDLWKCIGISKSKAYETVSLLKLPLDVQDKLLSLNIKDRKYLRALLKSDNPIKLLENIVKKSNGNNNSSSNKSAKTISYNLLSFKNDEFVVAQEALSNLGEKEKKQLKRILENIINEL